MTEIPLMFETPRRPVDRPSVLMGQTYKVLTPNGSGATIEIELTINELDGKPFEVFLQTKDAGAVEILSAVMILVSRLLRLSVPLEVIASDLEVVASAKTSHFAECSWCPSLVARLARIFKSHESRRQAKLDLLPPDSAVSACTL